MRHPSGMIVHSDGSKPYTVSVMKALADAFPYIINRLGGRVVREVRGQEGTGKMSFHSYGRAVDIYLRVSEPHEKLLGQSLFDLFRDHATLLKTGTVIFNGKASTGGKVATTTKEAGVRDVHDDHVHVDFLESAMTGSAAGTLPMLLLPIIAKLFKAGYGEYQTGLYGPAYNPDSRREYLTTAQRRAVYNHYKQIVPMDVSAEYLKATRQVGTWIANGKIRRPAGLPEEA